MSQKSLRTLFLWVIWTTSMLVVYLTLYQDFPIHELIASDTSHISILIIILFCFGFVASFVLTLLITLEAIAALRIEDAIRGNGLARLETSASKRLAYRFFAALKDTVDNNGRADVEALLNVELAPYHRISHSIEVIGNLLITLGLIGTVMGMTITLSGLGTSLDAIGGDQDQLLTGLRKAMSGMGTAFYTTLFGAVLGGILLRVYAQITDNGVDGLFDKLMRTCLIHCSADLQPSMDRDIRILESEIESLGKSLTRLQVAFHDTREAMQMFREEITELKTQSRQENEVLLKNILLQQQQSESLRNEARLLRRATQPWWRRLVMALGLVKPKS
ncbi:MAG: MotA/TolQ/ExbB proton channel family protein [Gammaproteobacteria bacterium]|nr:MotA/TolQ/ExbB proton channel family protein [Gammaproteobacteria bacterium]